MVAKESRYARRLTLKQYLDALHVGVGVLAGRQTVPEQRLALGHKRICAVEVPYFTAAIRCVAGTDLIATVPKRLAELERHDPAVKILQPPPRQLDRPAAGVAGEDGQGVPVRVAHLEVAMAAARVVAQIARCEPCRRQLRPERFHIVDHEVERAHRTLARRAPSAEKHEVRSAAKFADGEARTLHHRPQPQGLVECGRTRDVGDPQRNMADGEGRPRIHAPSLPERETLRLLTGSETA